MLWSIVKVTVYVALVAVLAYGAAWLMDAPGEISLAFAGREWTLSPLGFVILGILVFVLVWVLIRLAGLVTATIRFLTGDETALSRFFDKSRERKGYRALSDGMIALASGDSRAAMAQATKAERLLQNPRMTRLLNAQAAEMDGNTVRATGYYKEMLQDDLTRFIGIRGLMRQKLEEGDTETAAKLAQKALEVKPKNLEVIDTLFEIQAQEQDWGGARQTLDAKVRAGGLPKDVGTRRSAVLSLAEAMEQAPDSEAARSAAIEANRLAPTLVPAAALAARAQVARGNSRAARKTILKAWATTPHPDLAAAYAQLEPGETPGERLTRFAPLFKAAPDHPESVMLKAELQLAAEEFPAARSTIAPLVEEDPTARSLAIMAAAERGTGAEDRVVRGWLAKALEAPRGPQWVCSKCRAIHAQWHPVCASCEAFDTLSWTALPKQEADGQARSAMLPLIVGLLSEQDADTADAMASEGAEEEIEDAEEVATG
ncbi:heme biosynthesis protein HemY [Oceanomicrobium pacificus]|uniref:Heme biosynthesis protein HemY n=1 Tax=Oceanomicrobium pacificus TaxID=2692916 RepID=A0A6B0TLN7_9RHOB|nr:heme biosynthesis HemY N-terminal domain-containing protein [Oceanomicrobium pacificus]MXU64806.1 heme biosynthesis protein HemY [Oceanomicrobium pacificus]